MLHDSKDVSSFADEGHVIHGFSVDSSDAAAARDLTRPLSIKSSRPMDIKMGGLLKHHLKDWVVILVLIILEIILNIIKPFYRFVGSFEMDSYKYPYKSNTIPFWAVPIIAFGIPLVLFCMFFFWRRNVQDMHHALLGLFTAVLLTAVLTDAIKDAVGRPRPDFFWRCFPDGIPNFNTTTFEAICHGSSSAIKEGHKSFPSGHTSWSFAGLGYLSFYLAGKLTLFDKRGHSSRLSIVALPLLLATLVAISRVDDYWHHWQDVFAGALLGLVVAGFCYKQHYPWFGDENGANPFPHILPGVPLPTPGQNGNTPGWDSTNAAGPGRTHGGEFDLEGARTSYT